MRARALGVGIAVALLPVAPAAAKPTALSSGSAAIAFDPAFGVKLIRFGVTPGPIAPATQEGLTITAPVRKGSFVSRSGRTATIRTAGGISQQGATFDLKQLRLRFTVHRSNRVVASSDTAIKGVLLDRFDFATGKAKSVKRTKRGYQLRDVALKLNDIGAATLNSQLRTLSFAVGEPIGVATIVTTR